MVDIGKQAEFLRAGAYTRRYHGWRTLMDDLVGVHSFNVANIVQLIRPLCRKELLLAAIRHDGAEWVAGDAPSTAKRAVPDLKVALDAYESSVWLGNGFGTPTADLSDEEKLVLKLADYLDGMMFCLQERQMGNQLIDPVFAVFCGYMIERLPQEGPLQPEHHLYNHVVLAWIAAGGTYNVGE